MFHLGQPYSTIALILFTMGWSSLLTYMAKVGRKKKFELGFTGKIEWYLETGISIMLLYFYAAAIAMEASK